MRFGRLAGVFVLSLVSVGHFDVGLALAAPKTFKIDETPETRMQFTSDATLEKFTGTSGKLSGEIKLDPAKVSQTKADVKLDVTSIKTGISLRDEHLQGANWLDGKKYPHATFVITKVSGAESLKPNESVDVKITGKFSLHGVTKEVIAPAKVRWIAAADGKPESVRVQASFDVKLEDHKVSIPSIVALKVAKVIKVNVDFHASVR